MSKWSPTLYASINLYDYTQLGHGYKNRGYIPVKTYTCIKTSKAYFMVLENKVKS